MSKSLAEPASTIAEPLGFGAGGFKVLKQEAQPLLQKLAKLANIPDGANRKSFDDMIVVLIAWAHAATFQYNAKERKLPARTSGIARNLAEDLAGLGVSNRALLAGFLRVEFDSFLTTVKRLADAAQYIARLRKAKSLDAKTTEFRKSFVTTLLNGTHNAGGRLSLDRTKNTGTLVEAIELLRPCLPPDVTDQLSFSSLRRIYDPWRKSKEPSKGRGSKPQNRV